MIKRFIIILYFALVIFPLLVILATLLPPTFLIVLPVYWVITGKGDIHEWADTYFEVPITKALKVIGYD